MVSQKGARLSVRANRARTALAKPQLPCRTLLANQSGDVAGLLKGLDVGRLGAREPRVEIDG